MSAPEASPQYEGVDHIAIVVEDLEEAKRNYAERLGFRITGEETLEDRGIRVAFVDAVNTRLELVAPLHDASEVSAFLRKRGPGIHHICMKSRDVDHDFGWLTDHGARMTGEAPKPGAGGAKVAFVHPKSANGVLIEIAEGDHHE